jgi:hypothetical protein
MTNKLFGFYPNPDVQLLSSVISPSLPRTINYFFHASADIDGIAYLKRAIG